MKDHVLHITVKIPKDSCADDVAEFCADALSSWGGQFHPDDPLFHSLQVKSIRTATKIYKLSAAGNDQ